MCGYQTNPETGPCTAMQSACLNLTAAACSTVAASVVDWPLIIDVKPTKSFVCKAASALHLRVLAGEAASEQCCHPNSVHACQPIKRYSLELAIEISLTSLGSSQTLRRPHFRTEAASRFCSFSETMLTPPCVSKHLRERGSNIASAGPYGAAEAASAPEV